MVGGRYRVEESKREKKWDNCNSIINKIYFKIIFKKRSREESLWPKSGKCR